MGLKMSGCSPDVPEIKAPRLNRRLPDRAEWRALQSVVDAVGTDSLNAAIVFGSLARDERRTTSDIDLLLVIQSDTEVSRIRARVRAAAQRGGIAGVLTSSYLTATGLIEQARSRPSFAAHLVYEAVVLWEDPGFAPVESALRAASLIDDEALRAELIERTAALPQLSKLERFNGEYLPTLSHLYTIGRSVVIISLMQDGIREYSWTRAFDTLAERRPQIGTELARLRALRPYYDHVRGRARLPESAQVVEPEIVEAAIAAVKAVAHVD